MKARPRGDLRKICQHLSETRFVWYGIQYNASVDEPLEGAPILISAVRDQHDYAVLSEIFFDYHDLRDDICDEGLDIKQDIHAGMSSFVSLCDEHAVCSLLCLPDQ